MHSHRSTRQIHVQDDIWDGWQKTLPVALLHNVDVVAARFKNIREYTERIARVRLNV